VSTNPIHRAMRLLSRLAPYTKWPAIQIRETVGRSGFEVRLLQRSDMVPGHVELLHLGWLIPGVGAGDVRIWYLQAPGQMPRLRIVLSQGGRCWQCERLVEEQTGIERREAEGKECGK